MSLSIGPNGFHDGEAPEYDSSNDDDGDALSKLCDNPAYLVVGSDDDLVDNLPSAHGARDACRAGGEDRLGAVQLRDGSGSRQ